MTVETQVNKVFAAGNGVATTFSFSPMAIFQSSDLQVTKVTAAGVSTVLSEGTGPTNYSVTVASYPGTGSITYPASAGTNLATGETLTMKRLLTIQQTIDLENQGGYFADVQETALDRLTMTDLQQQEAIDRSIKFNVADAVGPVDLPVASLRAGLGLLFDALGALTVGGTPSVTIPAVMLPVVQAASIALARAALGSTTTGDALFTAASAAAALTLLGGIGLGANTFTANQVIQSTDAGAGEFPVLTLDRFSASPAVSDNLGGLHFDGRSSTGVARTFAALLAQIADPVNATEDAQLFLRCMVAGTLTSLATFGPGVVLSGAAGGDKGLGTINAQNIYINGTAVSVAPAVQQLQKQLYLAGHTGSGTFVVPTGVTRLHVIGGGAGGGGGGGDGGSTPGLIGGSGFQAESYSLTVVPAANLTITIGTAGNGGANNTNGTKGGDTKINNGADIFIAKGGTEGGGVGGAGITPNTASQCTCDAVGTSNVGIIPSGSNTAFSQPGAGGNFGAGAAGKDGWLILMWTA